MSNLTHISRGISNSTISSADILSLAITASVRKRKAEPAEENCDPNKLDFAKCNTAPFSVSKSAFDFYPSYGVTSPPKTNINHQEISYNSPVPQISPPQIQQSPVQQSPDSQHADNFSLTFNDDNAEAFDIPHLAVKDQIALMLWDILNNGDFDKLTSLRHIGKVRATKIMTARNSGKSFNCVKDLEDLGMNKSAQTKFIRDNLPYLIGY